MSDHTANVDRVVDLAGAVCDETASLNDLIELDSIVVADEASRRRYWDYCWVHAMLGIEARVHRALRRACDKDGLNSSALTPWESEVLMGTMPPNAPSPPAQFVAFPCNSIHSPVGYFSGWPMAYLIATVIFGIGAVIGSFTYVSHPVQVADQLPAVVKDYLATEPRMVSVGRITGMIDCKWADPATAPVGINVVLGHKYALASGLVEITYDTGAKVILQGPVTYDVEAKNGGFMSRGKLTGKVTTEAARGLTIRTPTATVTDLGTEFGVEVDRDGESTTRVFVGKVRLTAVGGRGGSGCEQEVCAGHAARVGADGSITAVNDSPSDGAKRFVRVMPPIERIRTSDAYAKFVLSMQPVLYYRMDRPKNDNDRWVVFDSGPGGYHGELHLTNQSGRPYASGRFGDSFQLLKPPVVRDIVVPDYPKTTNGQLSLSAWVFAENRPASATIASNWTTKSGQFHFGLHDMDGDLSVVLRAGDGSRVALRDGISKPFPLYRWQHVVFVADGSTVRLYRNGIETASRTCAGIARQDDVRHLAIGCTAERRILCKPTAITGSAPYEPDLYVENLIDGDVTVADIGTMNNLGDDLAYPDYASLNRTSAFVSMEFGSAFVFDTLVYSQRPNSPSTDTVSRIDLWFGDAPFSLSDPGRTADETLSITETSPKLTKYDLGSAHTARYVLARLHLKDGVDGFAGGSELLLGSADAAQGKMLPYHFWYGRLDEIAVFNHALTAEQVGQLYTGNTVTRQEASSRLDVSQQDSRGSSGLRPVPGKEVKE